MMRRSTLRCISLNYFFLFLASLKCENTTLYYVETDNQKEKKYMLTVLSVQLHWIATKISNTDQWGWMFNHLEIKFLVLVYICIRGHTNSDMREKKLLHKNSENIFPNWKKSWKKRVTFPKVKVKLQKRTERKRGQLTGFPNGGKIPKLGKKVAFKIYGYANELMYIRFSLQHRINAHHLDHYRYYFNNS